MVGIIKNLFGGKDNYYAQLDENEVTETNQQQTASEVEPQSEKIVTEQKEATSTPEPSTTVSQQQPSMLVQNNAKPPEMELKGDTFAPDNLTPKATPFRRRPGANMENFKALAREVNVPRNQ